MEATILSLELPDGRVSEALVGGDSAGYPLVLHHGSPGDLSTFADWHEPCQERGIRLICASRPGYANSSRWVGRTVAQVAGDVSAILDSLGHGRFITAGWSGGGPHALACAALLSDRCAAAATLASLGPCTEDGLDFFAGMGAENISEFSAALEGEEKLRHWMAENAAPFRTVTGEVLAEAMGSLAPDVDIQALVGGYADTLAATIRRSLGQGFDGWIDDDLAFTRPWGFAWADLRAPITVWQGAHDRVVPFAHGRWLVSKVPGARGRMVAGHGHISLVAQYRLEILDELMKSALG